MFGFRVHSLTEKHSVVSFPLSDRGERFPHQSLVAARLQFTYTPRSETVGHVILGGPGRGCKGGTYFNSLKIPNAGTKQELKSTQ